MKWEKKREQCTKHNVEILKWLSLMKEFMGKSLFLSGV